MASSVLSAGLNPLDALGDGLGEKLGEKLGVVDGDGVVVAEADEDTTGGAEALADGLSPSEPPVSTITGTMMSRSNAATAAPMIRARRRPEPLPWGEPPPPAGG
ncbi:hypothetical protein [Candidatus Frankia nodulisporulans]|uniref:hypothetical protein n=1 Tax=Candidatus Frankia nodulisporulans TaxID=2060052 RepID=UPI0013D052C6|nr:hypothetical protein [Candidatus Frankia nodulisporulans]